jgi:hypothetical protein
MDRIFVINLDRYIPMYIHIKIDYTIIVFVICDMSQFNYKCVNKWDFNEGIFLNCWTQFKWWHLSGVLSFSSLSSTEPNIALRSVLQLPFFLLSKILKLLLFLTLMLPLSLLLSFLSLNDNSKCSTLSIPTKKSVVKLFQCLLV